MTWGNSKERSWKRPKTSKTSLPPGDCLEKVEYAGPLAVHTRVPPSYSPQGTKQEPHAILVLLNWPTTEYLILCHIPIAWVRIDQPIPSRVKDVTEQPKHRNMLDNNPKDAKNMNRFAHEIAQASSVDSCLGLYTPSTSICHAWPTIGTLWHR